ncbi:MAG: GNAT family N-acetyltransferase [Desulfurococcales archaeon]|nr:GNAT family N-acetyltransferase [Desulfurococcales archaeon]
MPGGTRLVSIDVDNVDIVYRLVRSVYKGFEDITLESLKESVAAGQAMAALVGGEPVAFASSIIYPGVVEARNLAVRPGYSDVLRHLLEHMFTSLGGELRVRLARVSALGIPSIIEAASRLGLKPTRRILKVKWNLHHSVGCPGRHGGGLSIVRAVELGQADRIAEAYLEGLATHWKWWIEADKGGYNHALAEVTGWIQRDPSRWLAALVHGKVVGVAGYARHNRLPGTAWLAGVAVKPGYRLQEIGSTLLCTLLDIARDEGFREAIVYTYSPIVGLAPGATLYIKRGGLIQAEYIHFEGRASQGQV